jgi:hypothetical protein
MLEYQKMMNKESREDRQIIPEATLPIRKHPLGE